MVPLLSATFLLFGSMTGWVSTAAVDASEVEACHEREAFESGLASKAAGQLDRAEIQLSQAFARDPICVTSENGSVAYWLGRVLWDLDKQEEARRMWIKGIEALSEAGRRDLRLHDGLVVATMRDRDETAAALAGELYQEIVAAACEPANPWEREVLVRRVAQLAPLIDDIEEPALSGRRASGLGHPVITDPSTCVAIWTWFEESNPFPASPVNVRVIEHLARVTQAEQHFAAPSAASGYDDRGAIFVRYGEPGRNYSLRYNDLRFAREVFRFGVDVSRSDFADHEIWSYFVDGIEHTFIFVRDRRGYKLGTSLDLLPHRFRSGFNHLPRGQNHATAALAAMRWIYERLAVQHSGYGSIYREISAYDDRQNAFRTFRDTNPQASSVSSEERVYGVDYHVTSLGGADLPSHFIQDLVARTGAQERELVAQREELMPAATTTVDGVDRLELHELRHARLLARDGTTRVLVFWRDGLSRHDDSVYEDDFGLYHRARLIAAGPTVTRSLLVDSTYLASARAKPVVSLEVPIEEALPGAALQVDRHLRTGGWLGSGRIHMPAIDPLIAEPGRVELSDLIPFEVENLIVAQAQLREEPGVGGLPLFPGRVLGSQEALGAYFEVYVPGEGNQLRDIILTYEVVRTRDGRLLRPAREETMILPFRRVSVGARLPAAFFVDRAAWADADRIKLVVTVTDLETGREVERMLEFDVTDVGQAAARAR